MTQTQNEAALLAAVVASPDDDSVRLVYADALSARGDARGEFIAVQCALARNPADAQLAKRSQQLLQTHGRTWLAALGPGAGRFTFTRGFVEEFIGPIIGVTRRGALVPPDAVLLRRFQVSIDGQHARVELARPTSDTFLRRAHQLSIRGRHAGETREGLGPIAELHALASMPFESLRSLALQRLRVRGLEPLLTARALTGLEALCLRLGAQDEVERACAHLHLPLQHLEVSRTPLGSESYEGILRMLKTLRSLTLDQAGLIWPMVRQLSSTSAPLLRELSLAFNPFGDEGAAWLSRWQGASALERLNLRGCRVSTEALDALRARGWQVVDS